MNKQKKIIQLAILSFFLIVVVFLISFFYPKRKFLFAIPHILSSYYSKIFCSCYYVMQQTEEYCHDYTKQLNSIEKFQHDKKNKKITVKWLWKTNTAYYTNKRNGCVLEPYK